MNNFTPPERERLVAELRQLLAAMSSARMQGPMPLMDLDLSIPQLKVVLLLAEEGSMRMSALAQALGITVSACTHLVDKVVRTGFVVRSEEPSDRRVVLCAATDKGRSLVERLRQSMPFQQPEFLDRLTVEELRVIVQAMAIFQRVMMELKESAASDAAGVQGAGR